MNAATINIDSRPFVVADVHGRVVDGPEFVPDSEGRYRSVLGRCVGREITLRAIRQKKRRSSDQNSFYWGVVLPDILKGLRELAESVGELPVFTDEDELHEALKWVFLRKVCALPGAGNIERMPRSSQLSVAEFSEYLDKVRQWAAERNIWVRAPHEAGVTE